MKKRILTIIGALTFMVSVSFGQLIDEKNVSLTMDLQPILQLSMQGSDQIDFVFDDIYDYVGGITKFGATVLKVSSSVSFDLWATGLSQNTGATDFIWDNPVAYGGGGGTAVNTIPVTGVELHQFPPNPTVTAAAVCAGGAAYSNTSDYSASFTPATFVAYGVPAIQMPIIVAGNNTIYASGNTTPYAAPVDGLAAINAEKFIAGGAGTAAGCQVVGGTYLTQTGVPTAATAGYYFTMDYRILPGLPAVFPSHNADIVTHTGAGGVAANAIGAAESTGLADANTSLGDILTYTNFAAPGVYTMYVKYVLVQDQ